MWLVGVLPVFVILSVWQGLRRVHDTRHQIAMHVLPTVEQQADLYGRLWSRMLISRQIFIDFAAMEGYDYPDEFVLLVEAIDGDRDGPLAVRYRKLMNEVLGPIQNECLELIMNKKWLVAADGDMPEFLLEYMLMASSYKIIFSRWDSGDYHVHFSSRRFPPELIDQLHQAFLGAKRQVDDLTHLLARTPTVRDTVVAAFRPDYTESGRGGSSSSSRSGSNKDGHSKKSRRFPTPKHVAPPPPPSTFSRL